MIAEKIYAALDEVSQRNTKPRHLIAQRLVELAEDDEDFTIDDLWHELREKEPTIGRATVFRTVEKLAEMRLLDRIDFADGTHHYHVSDGVHHHHLTCTQCHRVVEIDLCLPQTQLDTISQQTNFVLEGHALTLFGRCKQCRI
jgi:Fur family transcriptional regulator, ferric uptake regulator